MAKLIFRSNYFKNESAKHKSNYIKYLGTREGAEMNPELAPGYFYEDEDMHGRKKNYMDYISGRPGVVKTEGKEHGLFSYQGQDINLEQVMDEVANHEGRVWINVISLMREDAERLGYNNIERWQKLLRRHVMDFASGFNIDVDHLKWYAAFHNEGHHPHVHMVIYSDHPSEGFLRQPAIEDIKSKLMNDIFKDYLKSILTDKSLQRAKVKEEAKAQMLRAIQRMHSANVEGATLICKMSDLSLDLRRVAGRKVYGYLRKEIKQKVDEIVAEIARIPEVKEAYEKWYAYQNEVNSFYSKEEKEWIPMEKNKEFRSVANMVIAQALAFGVDEKDRQVLENLTKQAEQGDKNARAALAIIAEKQKMNPDLGYLEYMVSRLLMQVEKMMNASVEDNKSQLATPVKDERSSRKEREWKIAKGHKVDEDDGQSQV